MTQSKHDQETKACEPVAWIEGSYPDGIWFVTFKKQDGVPQTPLYASPPDTEALRQQVKELDQQAKAGEPVWIQPNHLAIAQRSAFLCRVEPKQRLDFVPLYPALPDTEALRQRVEELENRDNCVLVLTKKLKAMQQQLAIQAEQIKVAREALEYMNCNCTVGCDICARRDEALAKLGEQ